MPGSVVGSVEPRFTDPSPIRPPPCIVGKVRGYAEHDQLELGPLSDAVPDVHLTVISDTQPAEHLCIVRAVLSFTLDGETDHMVECLDPLVPSYLTPFPKSPLLFRLSLLIKQLQWRR